jgi:prepilin-type N-terminal cleavage/methylation domain-containing protein
MNQKGFTLIEMMIVMMIISILLIITIPNVSKNNSVVKDKGCSALVKLAEAQVQAFEIEKGVLPVSLDELMLEGYLDTITCPGGGVITYTSGAIAKPDGY